MIILSFLSTFDNGQTIALVIVSISECRGSYSLQSDPEAQLIGQDLWEGYGNTNGTGAMPRPSGIIFVNGGFQYRKHNWKAILFVPDFHVTFTL
ncbi:hypothetical protein TSTA_024550 [Talaromyces stipitatus ATCC 10500]|uniref:Uncharacterized protein n=1 Tax=Talaromyces stipitatus (strain ATCC 10500 / CBS 375.48 / QM 6759 / NRRL 1006) TaxID=441959 RepID=B8M4D6_TALSN|nr:uncharacterized protein TSTA_024550 [Talaromyces stipitatus ATCC 10500]EED19131.1 hypothetical protein TSTA_024550 [Talaromyces stipitatus ATCC 10500]